MKINPWMKCVCGKIHIATFATRTTKCKCGELILPQLNIHSVNARGSLK